jgi:hypothetical protein
MLPRGLPQTAASQVLLYTNLHGDNILGAQGTEVTLSLMPTTRPRSAAAHAQHRGAASHAAPARIAPVRSGSPSRPP